MADEIKNQNNVFKNIVKSTFNGCFPFRTNSSVYICAHNSSSGTSNHPNIKPVETKVVESKNKNDLIDENEEFLSVLIKLPAGKSNAYVYRRAAESAFARIIQQAENIKTFEQYLQFCEVCAEFEQHQPIRVAFGLIYLTDMRLRRDVETLFVRAAQEYADCSEATTAGLQLNLLAILHLIGVVLADASIDFTTVLSLQRYFTESLARLIVEGMTFYATMYFQVASDTLSPIYDESANYTMSTSMKMKKSKMNLRCRSEPDLRNVVTSESNNRHNEKQMSKIDTRLSAQDRSKYKKKLSNSRVGKKRSKSVDLASQSKNQLSLLSLFLELEKRNLNYKRVQFLKKRAPFNQITFLQPVTENPQPHGHPSEDNVSNRWSVITQVNEQNSARHWSSNKNYKATQSSNSIDRIDSSSFDHQPSNVMASDAEHFVMLRCEVVQQLSNCLGRFIFGTIYYDIAAVPQCQQKLFVIFSYLNETKELSPILNMLAIIYWAESVAQCNKIFNFVATSAPLCIAFLKMLTKAILLVQKDSVLYKYRKISNKLTISKPPENNSFEFPPNNSDIRSQNSFSRKSRSKVKKAILKWIIDSFIKSKEKAPSSDQSTVAPLYIKSVFFDVSHYLSITVQFILLKMVTYCTEHYFHEIPNYERPLLYDMSIETILQKRFRLRGEFNTVNLIKGNVLTCKHPTLVALRNSMPQISVMAPFVTQTPVKSNLFFLQYIDLLLILENFSLAQPLVLNNSMLLSHRFKDGDKCSVCAKSCFSEHGAKKRKKKNRKYPLICFSCNMVRYCSLNCEKRWKDFHANWCSTLEKCGYA